MIRQTDRAAGGERPCRGLGFTGLHNRAHFWSVRAEVRVGRQCPPHLVAHLENDVVDALAGTAAVRKWQNRDVSRFMKQVPRRGTYRLKIEYASDDPAIVAKT